METKTARKTRSDIHRPSAIIPSDYGYLLSYLCASADGMPAVNVDRAVEIMRKHRDASPDAKIFGGCGSCGVCGAYFVDGSLWRHEPTGDLVHMGHDCADKFELLANDPEFDAAKISREKRREATRQATKNARARAGFLAAYPGLAEALEIEHPIIRDIAGRFQTYCTMSDKQAALVIKIAAEAWFPALPPKVEDKPATPPEGRIVIRGVVVGRKWVDSDFGRALKITIKVTTESGVWLAWGTCPRMDGAYVERGDEIELTAMVTKADNRPSQAGNFAFFKRPTKGRIITRAAQAAEKAMA